MTKLNLEQQQAVEAVEGPMLVIAGAGSGKTRVVTQRIVHMLELGVPSENILGLTFTNKAAKEMKERVRHLTSQNVTISTFHSLGARILRESIHALGFQRDFVIYDEEDSEKLLKTALETLNLKGSLKEFRHLISESKNGIRSPDQVSSKEFMVGSQLAMFPKVYETYQSLLKTSNAVDFDDLLYLPVKLFQDHPDILEYYRNRWQFLLVDEYQDTNAAQYALILLLTGDRQNLCVVGDPDQSIYSWRGADIRNILNFKKDFPDAKVINLEHNYRSVSNILEGANAVIRNNQNRYEKNLWSTLGEGDKIKLHAADSERHEAEFVANRIRHLRDKENIPLRQIAVFYRTNSQSRAFEDQFLVHRIPYVIVGGVSFYQRREIKDILALLRMVLTGNDYIAFQRTINIPKRGIGDATIEKLRFCASERGIALLTLLEEILDGTSESKLRLNQKQKEGIKEYLGILQHVKGFIPHLALSDIVRKVIEQSGYIGYLKEDPESYEDRKENLDALITKAVEWEQSAEDPSIYSFLEELSLKSSLDMAEGDADRISLMTIHNSKGLEFRIVFLVGLEDGLFPHINSQDSRDQLEEERRLFYVGMTRAKEQLYLTFARTRYLWGSNHPRSQSPFIKEIPVEYVDRIRIAPSYVTARPKIEVKHIDDIDQTVPETEFNEGDIVMHKDFGYGTVRGSYNSSLGVTYKILFAKDQKERSIVAKLARLQRL